MKSCLLNGGTELKKKTPMWEPMTGLAMPEKDEDSHWQRFEPAKALISSLEFYEKLRRVLLNCLGIRHSRQAITLWGLG